MIFCRICLATLFVAFPSLLFGQLKAPLLVATNTTIRVMAANLTTGSQYYEAPGLNIMKGLKPDVVAIQEFKYISTNGLGTNTPAAFREMIDRTFGTNFVYFRESEPGYNIPNGIISRFPIIESGSWDDTLIPDRGFAWAELDIPGTNDLYVVSVHLKASSSSSSTRATEASNLKALIQAHLPTNAFLIVAGDCNIASSTEAALATFKTFLSDNPIPTDAASGGDADTNAGRSERYDYVFPSFTLDTNRVPSVIGSKTFTNGLVFDSRIYTPLSDVPPVQSTDSGANQMQHMAVVKDFRLSYIITNFVDVVSPQLRLVSTNIVRWSGQTNVTYRVRTSVDLTNWTDAGTVSSFSTNFSFTNETSAPNRTFYQVLYP